MKYINPKSMTWWSGLAMVGYGIAACVAGNTDDGIQKILEGLMAIGIRSAIGTFPQ